MTTGDRIALGGLLVALVGTGAAVAMVPEVRVWLRIERPKATIGGVWRYQMHSDIAGNNYSGSLELTQDGDIVSGMMDSPDPDPQFAGKAAVRGSYKDGTLSLTRPTNRSGVMQEYLLRKNGPTFEGTFDNVGQTSGPFKDAGTIQLHR